VRRYRQFCPLARSLDLLGDRWSLLVVRELALRPCRYTDLRDGLPGIATNLLAERLRELQEAGIVRAEHAPPPVATTLYSLTDWGAQLRPILVALGRWGLPLMAAGRGGDAFRSRWVVLGVGALFQGLDLSDLEPVTILLASAGGGQPVRVTASPAGVSAEVVPPGATADVIITADPDTAVGLLNGQLSPFALQAPASAGVRGSEDALRRLERLAARAREALLGLPGAPPEGPAHEPAPGPAQEPAGPSPRRGVPVRTRSGRPPGRRARPPRW
jgi:DNA-binding HxlR family transcriptional regulator